ncbi:hypothetical protein RJ639_016868 [Escallonia herrerae]|uniref:Uncharacterized protein n=1 Tax=Escallonia herrerae TaxID=1293975 RepID=A0AA89AJL4_9ASTE|nr:hypothetical protein RJ639_016868 [Escallonia herrerae]
MSSTYDTHEEGEVQYQEFLSEASLGRVLCIKGRDTHDGAWNYYAFAWPEALPHNATFLEGLTFVSNNHYNYDNIWHGLCAMHGISRVGVQCPPGGFYTTEVS